MEHALPGEGAREGFYSPIAAAMDEDRAELRPEPTPRRRELPVVPANKYRFRTLPEAGRKRFEIPLLIPHIGKEDPLYEAAYGRYKNWATRQMKQGRIPADEFVKNTMMLKRDRDVFGEIHDYKIVFTPIRKSRECVYTTSNPIVADYIRWRISLGHFDFVVEDVRPLMIRIGDQEFPAEIKDAEGQRLLAKLIADGVDLGELILQGASNAE